MTLLDCRPGGVFRLHEVIADGHDLLLLLESGLVPGAKVRVIARGVAGGVVVAVGDARLALDARMGQLVRVEPTGPRPC